MARTRAYIRKVFSPNIAAVSGGETIVRFVINPTVVNLDIEPSTAAEALLHTDGETLLNTDGETLFNTGA